MYKIFSKVLANRLKSILTKVVSEEQSNFVLGRAITDNVLIAFEAIHYMKRETRGNKGYYAFKTDISKAYDRINWKYMELILLKMGFTQKWVEWLVLCISSADFSVVVNDNLMKLEKPGHGLR